jgi:type I restriction enzyme M protein
VSTAILVFTKTGAGGTDRVWFYNMKADGYSLDDKRTETGVSNIPDILERFHHADAETGRARTDQSFFVPKADIVSNGYDLSINRYKEVVYEQVQHDSPAVIMARLDELNTTIVNTMDELRGIIKWND